MTDLDEGMKKTMMDLVETNMKKHFIKSKMGWDEKKITSEMFRDPTAWYLIAEESEKAGNIVGFSHFRFDMDCSCDEVLYVYDIQIDSGFQGKGLGNFMMTSLETIGEYNLKNKSIEFSFLVCSFTKILDAKHRFIFQLQHSRQK